MILRAIRLAPACRRQAPIGSRAETASINQRHKVKRAGGEGLTSWRGLKADRDASTPSLQKGLTRPCLYPPAAPLLRLQVTGSTSLDLHETVHCSSMASSKVRSSGVLRSLSTKVVITMPGETDEPGHGRASRAPEGEASSPPAINARA